MTFQVYNRIDSDNAGFRLDGAIVSLDDSDVGTVKYVAGQQPYTFMVGAYGTTVKIILPGDNKTLSLAEVKVYGRTKKPVDGKK